MSFHFPVLFTLNNCLDAWMLIEYLYRARYMVTLELSLRGKRNGFRQGGFLKSTKAFFLSSFRFAV